MSEKFEPLGPISRVPVLGVTVLHMVVRLIRNIKNCVHKSLAKLSALLKLQLLLVNF